MFKIMLSSFQPSKYNEVLHSKKRSIISYYLLASFLLSAGLFELLMNFDIASDTTSLWTVLENGFGDHAELFLLIVIPFIVLIIPVMMPVLFSLVYKYAARKKDIHLSYRQWYKLFFVGAISFTFVSFIVEIIAFLFVDFSLTWIERVMTILFLTFMYKAGKAATTKKETDN